MRPRTGAISPESGLTVIQPNRHVCLGSRGDGLCCANLREHGCIATFRRRAPRYAAISAGFRDVKRYVLAVAVGLLAGNSPAEAGEIKVLSTIAVKSAMEELIPRFERESGHKVAISTVRLRY